MVKNTTLRHQPQQKHPNSDCRRRRLCPEFRILGHPFHEFDFPGPTARKEILFEDTCREISYKSVLVLSRDTSRVL